MKPLLAIVFTTIGLVVLFSTKLVVAGRGRFDITVFGSPSVTGQKPGINVQVWVRSPDRNRLMVGERVEFRVKNPRPGDSCTTFNNVVDKNGQVFGKCFATEAGIVTIYVYSLDNSDQSSESLLYFNNPTPTPTPKAKLLTPTPMPTLYLSPTTGSVFVSPTLPPSPTPFQQNNSDYGTSLVEKLSMTFQSLLDTITNLCSQFFDKFHF